MNRSLKFHLNEYASYMANDIGEPPDKNKMQELGHRLNLEIVYKPYSEMHDDIRFPEFMRHRNFLFKLFHRQRTKHRFKEGWYPGHFVKRFYGKKGVFLFIVNSPDSLGVVPRPVIILTLILILAFFFAWLILRNLVLPLKKMEEAFASASQGNFNTVLDLKRPRELASIGQGFNLMLQNIRRMLEGRQQMLRDVSHDLRTPLTRINLNLGFMKKSEEKNAIQDDVRVMERLLSDILDSYHFSQGSPELKLIRLDLRKLTEKIVKSFHGLISVRSLNIECSDPEIFIQGDEGKIIRLISNLVENALKYTLDNSSIQIRMYKKQNQVYWEIHDEGNSIPYEYRENIFQPFFQVESSRNPARRGYGLGLFICRRIAEEHGGGIEYIPGENGGSVFKVSLPIDQGG